MVQRYQLDDHPGIRSISLVVNAESGTHRLQEAKGSHLLQVLSNDPLVALNPHLHSFLENKTYHTVLNLYSDDHREGVATISNKLFARSNSSEKQWNLYLSETKPYELSLNYGMGKASVDLTGLKVEKLKIKSGSADVTVAYEDRILNPVIMDTFFVKVDVGDVNVKNINYANANNIMADVGFGTFSLNFDEGPQKACNVKASIGAGFFEVVLPEVEFPVIVKVHNSPLCHIKFCDGFTQNEDHDFVNSAYLRNPEEAIVFDLEVALGKIQFIRK